MFTNWLTSNNGNKTIHCNTNNTEQLLINGTATSSVLSSPPDVVLEVGPASEAVRFVAHSIVLGMHSGYLRSVVRLDEQFSSNNEGAATTNSLIIYISNVTAEQFAPLLTYMYTGYLDLNVENIFSVLLATHVLHMPRALEICRGFLARAQTDGYTSNLLQNDAAIVGTMATNTYNRSKIIRPIPSKPTLTSCGFLQTTTTDNTPITLSQQKVLQLNTFKNLQQPTSYFQPYTDLDDSLNDNNSRGKEYQNCEEIVVDHSSSSESLEQNEQQQQDEEIFIDACSDVEQIETKTRSKHKSAENTNKKLNTFRNDKSNNDNSKNRALGCLGLQVAKTPISAAQLETAEATKCIVDIASCDGPVRFRRILNTAYGHTPDAYVMTKERTQQSVSISFHQQMARTIRQQTEESENKESPKAKSHKTEIFVCVYCKHTFKSQYCYQKHAKRHINPLSLSCAPAPAHPKNIKETESNKSQATESTTQPYSNVSSSKLNAANGNMLLREVRPLDMNVQYYPCKTCGSKFPSYYFVHKHRKLCHIGQETAIIEERDIQQDDKSTTIKNHEICQEDT